MDALASARRLNKQRGTGTDAISITQEEIMNAVGIDVSKGKSMMAALRPMGEIALR